VQEIGLEKGDHLALKIQDDSTLLLIPRKMLEERKLDEKPKRKEYRVLVESKEDPQSICRKIIALYVMSADLICIRFKCREDFSKYKMPINNLIRNALWGSEITEETPTEITIQILINHPEFLETAIRRMATIALSADRDAISTLKNMDQDSIQSVIDTCNDVNRLNLYVIRQLKFGLEQKLFNQLGFKTPKEFLGYRIIANDIKSIAENAVSVVNNIITFKKLNENQIPFLKGSVNEELYSQITNFNSSSHQLFEESLKAMFERDYQHADRLISQIDSLTALESELITLISTSKMDPNVLSILRLIINGSRGILKHSRNIGEATLNRTVEEISSTRRQV